MSEHKAEVVVVGEIRPHSNADRLELTTVWGFQAVIGKGNFKAGDLAVFLTPDTIVNTKRDEFAFLAERAKEDGLVRLRRGKWRGERSEGLLIPAPPGVEAGENLWGFYDLDHYEPPIPTITDGEQVQAPGLPVAASKYDLESLLRYPDVLKPGEEVVATEKIHGANARFVWFDAQFYLGSRTTWKEPTGTTIWARAARAHPWILELCKSRPGDVFYGEVFGQVQSLKYGHRPQQEPDIRLFDVGFYSGGWMDRQPFEELVPVEHRAPVIYQGPFDFKKMLDLAEGKSLIPGADHYREGIVIEPLVVRYVSGERAKFKVVSEKM